MPELPDVEGFRRHLARALPDRRVRRVEVRDPGVLRNTTAQGLGRQLHDHRFEAPRRHGKWLILPTDGPALLVHSGMTGHPHFAPSDADDEPMERLVVGLDRGELRYTDQRKLRGVWIADDDDAIADIVGDQGPDALAIDLDTFVERLAGRRGALKPALMDQTVLAGLGNLLSDEICWQARIEPTRPVPDLAPDDVRRLHTTMRRVLRTSVRHERVPALPRWLTGVRDDPDPHCPRCGTALRRGRSGGRTTLWCPNCQPR